MTTRKLGELLTEREAVRDAQWATSARAELRPLVDLLIGDSELAEIVLLGPSKRGDIGPVLERMERTIVGLRAMLELTR